MKATQAIHYETYPRLSPSNLRNDIKGKSVLITGGNGGIGAGIAKSFAEAHAGSIILVGRNKAKLEATAKQLEAYKTTTKVTTHSVDVTSAKDVQRLFDSLDKTPDILINNAGYLPAPANFVDDDLSEYWKGFEINVLGTAIVTQSFLRHRKAYLPANAPPSVIIVINTIAAYSLLFPNLSAYGASKAALWRLAELVQVDVPESTARLISVHLGAVKTDMLDKSELADKGLGELTDVKLTADFTVWAASEEAKFAAGRFLWVNWDVDELVAAKEVILEKDLLRTSMSE